MLQKTQLAIHGGPRIRSKPMPPRLAFGNEELEAIKEVFEHYKNRKVDFGYQDTYERLYTDAFINSLEVDGYADAVCTGTAALFVAIAALHLPPGGHVIVSPITDPGTINAIILNQLVPVLSDSMPLSYNMGVEQFEERVTDKTKAVVVVHATGQAAPIDLITESAREKGIYVVEDCAQAHGARLNGQVVGTFGDVAAFSTMYRKAHSTGGCGGVVFTRNKDLYNLARAHSDRGKPFHKLDFNERNPTMFLFPALNLNLDEISCALGIKSLEKLNDTIKKRLDFLCLLTGELVKKSGICNPTDISKDDSPFFFPVLVDTQKISTSKKEFADAVRMEGIDLNPHYMYVVYEWPWVRKYLSDDFNTPNAQYVRDNSFNLYVNERYGQQEVADIIEAIIKIESYLSNEYS